ncbi:MAG: hypothetical protein Q7S84_02585 [bacterium]|nr:hypothetical protein [bacterium]
MHIPEQLKQSLAVLALVAILGVIVFVVMAVLHVRPGIIDGHPDTTTSTFRGPTSAPSVRGPSGPPPAP